MYPLGLVCPDGVAWAISGLQRIRCLRIDEQCTHQIHLNQFIVTLSTCNHMRWLHTHYMQIKHVYILIMNQTITSNVTSSAKSVCKTKEIGIYTVKHMAVCVLGFCIIVQHMSDAFNGAGIVAETTRVFYAQTRSRLCVEIQSSLFMRMTLSR